MAWIDIVVIILLLLSFIGGLKEGVIKSLFSLAILVIAIRLAGSYYYLIASLLTLLPDTNWQNFLGFYITLALVSAALYLLFLVPRRLIQKAWPKGVLSSLPGGIIDTFNASLGIMVLTMVLGAYPVVDWLKEAIMGSAVLAWLVNHLGFILAILPDIFQRAVRFI